MSENKERSPLCGVEYTDMKKKIIAIALCLTVCIGAMTLVSCTANTSGTTGGTGTGSGNSGTTNSESTTTATQNKETTTEAMPGNSETESSLIGDAKSIVDDVTNGITNGMGDPRFSDHPHRGMTPSGK